MRDLVGVSQAACDSCLILVTRREGGVNARRPRSCLFEHAMLNVQSVMRKWDEEWRLCFKGQLRGPPCMVGAGKKASCDKLQTAGLSSLLEGQ